MHYITEYIFLLTANYNIRTQELKQLLGIAREGDFLSVFDQTFDLPFDICMENLIIHCDSNK